jgi:autotransporter passenger strand-loop-strand repeat protein
MTLIESGGFLISAALSGGDATISNGGKASYTVISAGGIQTVLAGGSAINTTISSGGEQIVSGGVATGTKVDAGGTELLYGGGTVTGISGAGTLDLASGSFTLPTTIPAIGTIEIAAGVTLTGAGTLASIVADAGLVTAATGTLVLKDALSGAGTLLAAAGATVDIKGGGSFAGSLSGAGTIGIAAALTLDAGAKLAAAAVIDTASITLGVATSLANATGESLTITAAEGDTLKLSGATGDALSNAGSLLVNGAGTADVSLGFSNTGNVTLTSGSLNFMGTLTNSGGIIITGGKLTASKDVGGSGTLDLGSAGTLALVAGVAAGQTVDFTNGAGLLDLTKPTTFLGTIAGFAAGGEIDLLKTTVTSYSYTNSVLNLKDGSKIVASLGFSGSYTTSSFTLTSDSNGGTIIKFS